MKPGQEIVSYTPTKAALADLTTRFKGLVFDVTKPEGMRDAKAAAKEIAVHRITLEKARVAEKADALAYGKWVDSEAKKIAEQLAVLEDPIVAQIETETKREQREREAAVAAEQARLVAEEAARKAAEEKRLADERARNEAEARRLLEERARLDAEDRARKQAIADEEAAARKRIAEAEAAARAQRQAEEDRIAAERRKLEDEQRAKDEAARKEREALEARERAERQAKEDAERKVREEAEAKAKAEQDKKDAEARERQRLILEKADSRTSLELWRKRYGHLPEYEGVVRAIDECLEIA